MLARLAALEAKLERRYSADGEASFGDSSFESAGSMSSEWDRRGSSGSAARGRKRERDPEEEKEAREKDAQMQEMRVRMEMLEKKLAEM